MTAAGGDAGRSGADWVGTLVRIVTALVLLVSALRVLWQGWEPLGDAVVDATRAVSARPLAEVLVARPGAVSDPERGWVVLLRLAHRALEIDAGGLVVVSVLALFLAVSVPALLLLRRPEAWLLGLLLVSVADPASLAHLLSGDASLSNAALVLAVALVLRSRAAPASRTLVPVLAAASALVVWISGSWLWLFLLPAGWALAGRLRVARALALSLCCGVLLAGVLSWNLRTLLVQDLGPLVAFASGVPESDLLIRRFPFSLGAPHLVLSLLCVIAWRALRDEQRPSVLGDPLLSVVACAWTVGLAIGRPWFEYGVPLVIAWLSLEIEPALTRSGATAPPRRLLATGALACAVYLATSADVDLRWSARDSTLGALAHPSLRFALPDPGGVLYSDTSELFLTLFPRLPEQPFRYVLGPDPTLMTRADFEVYLATRRERRPDVFDPWIRRMGPADRLVISHDAGGVPPPFPGLRWVRVSGSWWSGRR